MASELLKVALHPTCSNSEVKLIDGQVVNLMLFYQSLSVKQLETLKHLICILMMMMAELIILFIKLKH